MNVGLLVGEKKVRPRPTRPTVLRTGSTLMIAVLGGSCHSLNLNFKELTFTPAPAALQLQEGKRTRSALIRHLLCTSYQGTPASGPVHAYEVFSFILFQMWKPRMKVVEEPDV